MMRAFNLPKLGRLGGDRRGNVAMIGALSAFVLVGMIGLSVDFSRAVTARNALQNALDAAALAIGGKPEFKAPGDHTAEMNAMAATYIAANLRLDKSFGAPTGVHVDVDNDSLTVRANLTVPSTIGLVLGPSLTTAASSTVVWGQTKLWVSLALDNTGSMSETDSKGKTKLSALITATNQLLDMLQGVAEHPGDVQVAIVPFSKTVNVGTNNANAAWLDWADWEAAPANASTTYNGAALSTFGPLGTNKKCPWRASGGSTSGAGSTVGYGCQTGSGNGSSTIGSSTNLTSAQLCPTVDDGSRNAGRSGRYYNGCFTGVKTNASCASNCTYTWTWVPNNHNTWSGCVMDRNQNYDVNATAPTNAATRFPAENSTACVPSVMQGALGHDWGALKAKTNAMTAGGNTNQTIGLQWAWMSQTESEPFDAPPVPEFTSRYIILLSDGLNTQNRWSSSQSAIDGRMTQACTNAKAAGFTIYSVYVNTGGSGNSSVMQNCASDPSKFYALTTSGAIVTAFNQIGQEITHLRVSR